MRKITLEISKFNEKIYYEIKVDGIQHQGTYVFETALSELMKLKNELDFAKGLNDGVKK